MREPPDEAGSLTNEHFIDDQRAADLLGLSRSYLRQLRVKGGGPRYSPLARKAVRYRVGDLLEWAASKAVSSTSEAPPTVGPGPHRA